MTAYFPFQGLEQDRQATVEAFDTLSKMNLKTSSAYQIKLNFQEFYSLSDRELGEAYLKRWYYRAIHSLEPMIEAERTIKRHWDGVLSWFGLTVI